MNHPHLSNGIRSEVLAVSGVLEIVNQLSFAVHKIACAYKVQCKTNRKKCEIAPKVQNRFIPIKLEVDE